MDFLPVVVWPHKALREENKPVVPEEIKQLARVLDKTMDAYGGLGIAANQVGINSQLFIISEKVLEAYPGERVGTSGVFANPEIISVGEEKEKHFEGCLSFPKIFLHIERPTTVTIKALDANGIEFEMSAEGLLARAILHEYDHISGALMVDYVGKLKREMVKKKLKKGKSG